MDSIIWRAYRPTHEDEAGAFFTTETLAHRLAFERITQEQRRVAHEEWEAGGGEGKPSANVAVRYMSKHPVTANVYECSLRAAKSRRTVYRDEAGRAIWIVEPLDLQAG